MYPSENDEISDSYCWISSSYTQRTDGLVEPLWGKYCLKIVYSSWRNLENTVSRKIYERQKLRHMTSWGLWRLPSTAARIN